jgi:hypothetical protein
MDRESMDAFRRHAPQYPIREFRTYADAEEFTRVNIAPPPGPGSEPFYPNFMGGGPHPWPPPMPVTPYMHHMGYPMGIHPPPSMYQPYITPPQVFAYPPAAPPTYAPPTSIPDPLTHVPTHIGTPDTTSGPNTTPVYILKENNPKLEDLKLPKCPEEASEFPTWEKKMAAILGKYNMHCCLIQDATTSESNKKESQAFAQALVQALPSSLLKNFMDSDSQYYDTHGIEMFQKLKNKILDDDDTIKLFRQLLSPKMSPKETPMDYKINIEQST